MKKTLFYPLLMTTMIVGLSGCKEEDKVSLKYEKYTLDNGLEVVLHEDHSDPTVSMAIAYHVGSSREKPGKTGFAHFFEHMLFQRSENLPRNAFFQKITDMGGNFNGWTANDMTVYFESVPRDALEKILWMESDRMGYFINTVTEGGLKREIDVVSNEKRQYENAPYGLMSELLDKNLFPKGHPYSWEVIGEIPDLRSATVEDVKEFYNKYYTPSNATLVLAGDFDKAQAKELIQKYFGEIPARPKPETPKVQNVTLDSTKRISYEDPFCNAPMIVLGYPSVEMYNEDGYALDFLCNLLAGDKKSPVYKVLVEERKLVPNVYMANSQLEIAGMIRLIATTFPGVNLNDVYEGYQEALARFEKEGIDPKDLERYKTMEETRLYNNFVSNLDKAQNMALNNIFGGAPDRSLKELAKYQAVTPEDVMRVYNKYIKGKPYLGLSIVPTGESALVLTGSVPAVVDQESIEEQELNSQGGAIVDDPYERTPSSFDRSVEPALLSNTPELNLPKIWNDSLSNGLKVSGLVYDELPLVNFTIELSHGLLTDTPEKAGLASLTANMLNEGTASKTPAELEEAIGQLGAQLSFQSGIESMVLSGSCLKKNYSQVMALVEEMLLHPRWDTAAFAQVKSRMLDDMRYNLTQPDMIAQLYFRRLVFGSSSILSFAADGTEQTLSALTLDDVKNYYETHLSPSVAKMSFVGGLNQKEVVASLASLEKNWKAKEVNNLSTEYLAPVAWKPESKVYFIDYPGARQSYILIGKPAMSIKAPDAYPAVVVNDRLGASSKGLLFDILRLKHGYTYGAYSNFAQGLYNNYFAARSSVQATVTKESLALFRDILSGYGSLYSQEDLDQTRTTLLRTMYGSFETPKALLGMLRTIDAYDLPEDYLMQRVQTLKAMTLDQAKEVIAKDLNFGEMVIVVVGDAKSQLAGVKSLNLGKVELVQSQATK